MSDEPDEPRKDPIAKSLGIAPLPIISSKEVRKVVKTEDYETAKSNLENIIETGTDALAEIMEIANLSQDSKDYRLLSELITALTTASKVTMEVKKQDIEARKAAQELEVGPQPTINQNLNITASGPVSLHELLEALEKKKQ